MNLFQKLFRRTEAKTTIVVKRAGRDIWLYHEGNYKMRIHAELLADKEGVVIYFNSIWSWLPPHDNNGFGLSFDERERVLKNFCRYLESHNAKYIVE